MTPEEVKYNRQRLAIEIRMKRADQRLALQQFEHQKKQAAPGGWKALMTPTGAVLTAAAFGLVGTAVGKWTDNRIEQNKQQTTIILKASEVPAMLSVEDQETQRARNLLWFARAGYLTLPTAYVDQLQGAASLIKGQVLLSPVIQSQGSDVVRSVVQLPGDKSEESPIGSIQRALGVSADGEFGAATRAAIREFQIGLYRRDPTAWPLPGLGASLGGRSASLLEKLQPMSQTPFLSPFERAFFGNLNDSGSPTLSTFDPVRLRAFLLLLGIPAEQRDQTNVADLVALMRNKIAELQKIKAMPSLNGAVLDSRLYDTLI